MTRPGRTPRASGALLLAVLIMVTACGRKRAPQPPEQQLPRAASGLSARIEEQTIVVSWVNPTRRLNNSRMRDLAVVRLYRADDAGAGEPLRAFLVRGGIPGYAEVARVVLAEPAPGTVAGDRVTIRDQRALTFGRRYTYVVVAIDAEGRYSAPSERLSVVFIAAPEAPSGLSVGAGDREARLTWAPTRRLLDGSASGALPYEVLRASGREAPLGVVSRTEPGVTRAADTSVTNEVTYYYAVRAVRTVGGTTAYGPPSERVAATPTDVTPPSPPGNLVAVPSPGEVRLTWSPSPEPDVAGYVVYRASGEGPFGSVGAVAVPGTTFVDRNVAPGVYRYVVTAKDRAPRPNESDRSNEVRVSVP
jgi:uncharacterized protein